MGMYLCGYRLGGMSEHHIKRLVIMRHAKADWPGGVADHDRPLEERGHREAPLAGKWLVKHDVVPDFILCSSALRTRQTCTWVCSELGDKAPTPKLEGGLYAASAQRMLTVINHVPDTVTTLMVISHMPGVQDLAMHLAKAQGKNRVLTCPVDLPGGGEKARVGRLT